MLAGASAPAQIAVAALPLFLIAGRYLAIGLTLIYCENHSEISKIRE
jgi:hypothetical protein